MGSPGLPGCGLRGLCIRTDRLHPVRDLPGQILRQWYCQRTRPPAQVISRRVIPLRAAGYRPVPAECAVPVQVLVIAAAGYTESAAGTVFAVALILDSGFSICRARVLRLCPQLPLKRSGQLRGLQL